MAGMKIQVDWEGLAKGLGGVLSGELRGILEGAEADLQAYGVDIAGSLARSIAEGKDGLTQELRGQLKALAEVHRLRINAASWEFFEQLLTVAVRAAGAVLAAAGDTALGGLDSAIGAKGSSASKKP